MFLYSRLFGKSRKAPRYVLFVNNGNAAFSDHINARADELKSAFEDEDYVFLSLDDVEASLDPEMMQYMFPWREPDLFSEQISYIIKGRYNVGDGAGLLRIKGKKTNFYPIEGTDALDVDIAIDRLLRQLMTESGPLLKDAMPMAEPQELGSASASKMKPRPSVKCCKSSSPVSFDKLWESVIEAQREEDSLESNTKRILSAWEAFSSKFNISIEELAGLLDDKLKVSRLTIRPSGAILLADYDNREVRMDDLTKALYFLYLLHPEGIRQKDLIDYRNELLELYLRITPRDDLEEIKVSVDNLLFDDNRINVSLSRIKKTFRDIFGDWIAKHYYVDGRAGEARSVKLDRDLVIWEH